MKIRIVGGPGSGKTTIAKYLAEKYSLNFISTDDFRFTSKTDFSKKRSKKEKTKLMNTFLNKNNFWIIEGTSFSDYSWKSFQEADFIFLIKKPLLVDLYYIFKRSFRQLIGLEKNERKEPIFAFIHLFHWAFNFRTNSLPKLITKLKTEKISYIKINKIKQIEKYIESNK